MIDSGDIVLRLGLDAAAIAALAFGIFLPRHRRTDLVVVFTLFNVGLFLAIVVITRAELTLGIGLGLFAVLAMIRLRSETFDNRELAYFFIALVLALVAAIDLGSLPLAGVLSAVALLAAWTVDHPRLSPQTRRLDVTLDSVVSDQVALRRRLEERLAAPVTEVRVLEIDDVRETTRVAVRYAAGPPSRREAPDAAVAVDAR
jgi:Domain of unknown function (DUF4956)